MALGALIIKAHLVLTDEELVEQIKENPYLQFFIDLEAFQYSAPFDPSMMVYFRKRLPESIVNDCNERIVRHGLDVIRSAESQDDGNDSELPSSDQAALPGSDKASSNQGTLLIDATCVPANIRYLDKLLELLFVLLGCWVQLLMTISAPSKSKMALVGDLPAAA